MQTLSVLITLFCAMSTWDEPPVVDLPFPADDDLTLTPWAQLRHLGDASQVTVVHASDGVPYLVRLSDSTDTVAAILCATCELLGCSDFQMFAVDCSSGLRLAMGHPAAGLCLWFDKDPIFEVSAGLADVADVSPTLPWSVDLASSDTSAVPSSRVDVSCPASVDQPGPCLEPLVNLTGERLLLVSEPAIPDCSMLEALRAQTMDSVSRKQVLAHQDLFWADDEMCFYMQQLLEAARRPTWAIMDPLLCAEAIKRPSSALIGQWICSLPFKATAILAVVCVEQRWIPFMWTWTPEKTIACSWDIPGSPPRALSVLHLGIASAVGSRTFTVQLVHRRFATTKYCGICALMFIDQQLRGRLWPSTDVEAARWHGVVQTQFVSYLDSVSSVPRPWIFAA